MIETAIALENLVERWKRGEGRRSAIRRDRLFRRICDELAPRMRRLIARYGMADILDDAHQACRIGVYRALESYRPQKSRFTTHVTWQMRGELQSLRHRVRLDQRQSARKAHISTVSLDALSASDGDAARTFEIVDECSLDRAEQRACDLLARRMIARLMEEIGSPAHERSVVYGHLFESAGAMSAPSDLTSEQKRQIVRRTLRNCAKIAASPMR